MWSNAWKEEEEEEKSCRFAALTAQLCPSEAQIFKTPALSLKHMHGPS